MKHKLICIIAVVIMLLLASASIADKGSTARYTRTHQHLTSTAPVACSHSVEEFCTNLPIVSLSTGGQQITILPKSETSLTNLSSIITASVSLIDSKGQNNHPADMPAEQSSTLLRYRGNSSLLFDKKSYKLNLMNEDMSENKIEFLGMPKHDEWALNGPFLDKTLIRNYLCLNISGEIMPYSPAVRFCELFVDGNYQGVYLAMETVGRSSDRVDLPSYRAGDPFSSYILRADRAMQWDNEIENLTMYTMRMGAGTSVEVVYPSLKLLTPDIKTYIERDFSKFEKALYSFDYNEDNHGYWNYIDVDSFVNYMVINEFFQNHDAGRYSTYFHKDTRGKIAIGPVWDFNNACDNYMSSDFSRDELSFPFKNWYFMLCKDKAFTEAVIRRYKFLRRDILSEERLLAYIDETVLYLGDAVSRNDAVWGYSYDATKMNADNKLIPDERNPADYNAAIAQLKGFIVTRGNHLDQNIENLRQYSHASKVSKFNH